MTFSQMASLTMANMAMWLHQNPCIPRVKRSGFKDAVDDEINRMVQFGVTSSLVNHRAVPMRCARVSSCTAKLL